MIKNIEPVIDAGMVCGIQNHRVNTEALSTVSFDGIDSKNGLRATFFCVQAGFLYAEPHHPFIRHCMKEFYEDGDRPFIVDKDKTNQFVIDWRMMAELIQFGAVYRDKEQFLDAIDLHLYDSSVFATRKSKTSDSYLIHWFDQSWKPNTSFKMRLKKIFKNKFYWLFRRL